jgi:O-antigen/teichoic acid export membrane protein
MNDNKRIAVNTIFLYAKFVITTVVSLVMSRVVLQALGASDYGLYNIVGGIVAMLNTLGTSMVATSYRYMAVEIGKGEDGNPNRIYNTVVVVHFALALFLLVIGETLGVFYVKNYLNVDPTKIPDALFVLHLSLLTTAFSVITIPMNGLIIAREKFLFTSVVESLSAIVKLLFAFILMHYAGNRLKCYAVMLAIIQFAVPLAYQIYCRVTDSEIVKWKLNKNKRDYKELLGFAWWILLGAMAVIGRLQGAAMIINYFFGTILNAAFGLASQVNNAVSSFTSTLRQSAIPQIMKNQGQGNEDRALTLVYAISRYSYLLMMFMAIPILLSIEPILKFWLGNPPAYTSIFVIFMLINGMISNLGAGFDASIQSTGKIRKNQIGYSLINLALLPLVFVLYKLGFPPYVNVICMALLSIITLVFQIGIMMDLTKFSLKTYINTTIKPSFLSTILSVLPLLLIKVTLPDSIIITVLYITISFGWTLVSIYVAGLDINEKEIISNKIKLIFNRFQYE